MWKKIWWIWGVPVIISFFAMVLLEGAIKGSGPGLVGRIFPFLVIACVAYFLGAALRDFWWKK